MLVNATNSRLVIGRFSLLPGEKVPTVSLTEAEVASVEKWKKYGYLAEKPSVRKSEVAPAPAPEPEKSVEKKAPASEPEKPVEKKAPKKSE